MPLLRMKDWVTFLPQKLTMKSKRQTSTQTFSPVFSNSNMIFSFEAEQIQQWPQRVTQGERGRHLALREEASVTRVAAPETEICK